MTNQTFTYRIPTSPQNPKTLVFSLLITFLVVSTPVFANNLNTNSKEFRNIEINVSGNDRTSTNYIYDLITDCIEDEKISSWQQLESNIIEQCVLNSKLFSNVEVEFSKPVIDVTVEERWTLLPIPYVYTSGDDFTLGLFLMENNLFGLGKKGGVGGNFSSNGTSYFLYYFDPSILFTDWSYSFHIGNKVIEPVLELDETEYYSYEIEEFSYGLNISRKVFLPELWLSVGFEGRDQSYEQVDTYPLLDNYNSYSVKGRAYYKDTDFKFYFNEGLQINLEYEVQVYRSDENSKTQAWDLTLEWQKQLYKNNAIQIQVQLQEVNDASLQDSLLLGREKGFRGIEHQGIWVHRAQSLSVDYQIPIKKYDYGTWTLAPFVDIAHYEPVLDLPSDTFISSGIGGYLYLKNIAFPGVGLAMGYNSEYDGFFVSFSLGMQR